MTPLRLVGHLLLWAGFLAGAFIAVRNVEVADAKWSTIQWPLYAMAILVGVAGVVVLRVTQIQASTHSEKLDADIETLESSIKHLLAELASIKSQQDTQDVFEVRHLIDTRLMDSINSFVEARKTLIHTFGLQQYATVMTDFSLAERNVNRAWSASADGYVDEVWLSLDRAETKFKVVAKNLVEFKVQAFGS